MKKSSVILLFAVLLNVQSSFAQAAYNFGETPADSTECVKNYSLYNEYFKQKEYKQAIIPLQQVLNFCPKLHKSIYVNGGKAYKALIKAETDDAKKQELVDAMLSLLDLREKNFGEEGYVLGKKGVTLYKYNKADSLEEAYKLLSKAYEMEADDSDPNAIYYYYKSLFSLYAKTKDVAYKQELLTVYDKLSTTLDNNLSDEEKSESSKSGYQKVYDEIDKIFSKVASCEDLNELYSKKYEAEPNNEALLKTITKILDKKGCTDSELFFKAASTLHKANPSYESSVALGVNQKDNCAKAAPFFIQAAELATTSENKIKAFMNASKCYLKTGQYSSSRTYANKALELNPNLGEAYIVIGTAYAASAGQCGDNNCTKKSAYWVAIDKFYKAKSVDESVAAEATKNINKYSAYFPSKEDCFFHNITEGSSYTVGCWINESTKVRFNR